MAAGVVEARLVRAGVVAPPSAPGVYRFRDAAGGLLYVGSSRDLRRRVASYFAPRHLPASKPARIARLAATVAWESHPSRLEALVYEARAIAAERPHFNRRLTAPGRHAWLRVDLADAFPRLVVTRVLSPGPARYLGPFPGGRALREAVERVADALALRTCTSTIRVDPGGRACLRLDLGRCAGPCVGRESRGAYGRRVVRALAALGGADPSAARALGGRAAAAPAGLPPGVAAAVRALRTARVVERVAVLVPAAPAPGWRLLAVAGGRLRAGITVASPTALRAAFDAVLETLGPPPPVVVPRDALDEVRIVTGWLAGRSGRGASIDVGRLGPAEAWRRLAARAVPGPLFGDVTPSARRGRA